MSESLTVKSKSTNSLIPYSSLTADQLAAIDRLYEYDNTLLIANMGGGKTVCALSAVCELVERMFLHKILVLAPLKVCNTVWAHECDNWEHLTEYSDDITICTGTAKEREQKLRDSGRVVVINFENIPWLVEQKEFKQFDGLIVDELTKLKGGGVSFKKLRKHLKQFSYRVGMTGTLVSENLESIFYQAMVIDNGKTFGRNKQKFLTEYFYPLDYNGYKWAAKPNTEKAITRMFRDYIYSMPDYRHTLPPLTVNIVPVTMPEDGRKVYTEMAKTMASEGVVADTVAVQVQKLQQISSGFLYAEDRSEESKHLHYAKYEKLKLILDFLHDRGVDITGGKKTDPNGVVIVYQYTDELEKLLKLFPDAGVIGGGKKDCLNETVKQWNSGKMPVLLLHPKSGGHGLNLAKGGSHIIWMSPVWSRDLFDQTNARLWRRGQTKPVIVDVLTCVDSVDELINLRLDDKAEFMSVFLEHLKML